MNYTIPNKKQRTHHWWCEGWWPICRVIGKQPLSSAMNMTRAEALRNDSYKVRGTIQRQRLDSTPCVPLLGHTLSCVQFSGHTCFLCVPIPSHRCFPLRTCDYAPLTGSPNWCCRCIGHCVSGWLGLLWRIAHECPSSECGDMLLTHPCVLALIRRRQPQSFGGGPQWDPDTFSEYCGLTVSQVGEAICAMRCVTVVPACFGDHSWSAQKATSIELTIWCELAVQCIV